METDREIVRHCLEQVAESGVDLAPGVYRVFCEGSPDAASHIEFMDERMRGRMLDQIYNVLLGDVEDNYLEFEARTHRGYGADERLYRSILEAVRDSVKLSLGEGWSAQAEAAWDRSINQITSELAHASQ